MTFLNTWQWNVVASLLCIVVYFQYYKLAVRDVKKDGNATVVLQILASLALLVVVPFFSLVFPSNSWAYAMLAIACIFYAVNDRMQTSIRKNLDISIFSIVNQLNKVLLIAIGILVFRNPLVVSKLIGAALIILGTVILLYRGRKLVLNQYIVLAGMASLFFAIALSIDIGISKQFNLPFYIILTLCIPAMYLFFAERMTITDVVATFCGSRMKYFLITGIAWGFSIFFSLRAYQLGEVIVIAPLQATTVLLNVFVARFFGERGDEMRKVAAAVLVIVGVYFTVL